MFCSKISINAAVVTSFSAIEVAVTIAESARNHRLTLNLFPPIQGNEKHGWEKNMQDISPHIQTGVGLSFFF